MLGSPSPLNSVLINIRLIYLYEGETPRLEATAPNVENKTGQDVIYDAASALEAMELSVELLQ